MPIVTVEMIEGRTLEQKKAMAEKVTASICETCKCEPEAVTIVIHDLPADNIAKNGRLLSEK